MFKKNTGGMSGQLQNRPDLNALHQLLSQGLEQRGKQLSLSWRSGGQSFTLFLICNVRGDPRWCLYNDEGNRQLVFDYNSCDPLLVFNLITSSTGKFQQQSRSPFLGGLAASRTKQAGPQHDFLETMAGSNRTTFSEINEWQPPGYQGETILDGGQQDDQSEATEFYLIEADQQSSALAWPLEPQSVENAWGDNSGHSGWTSEHQIGASAKAEVSPGPGGKPAPVAKTLKLKSRPIDGAVIQSVMMKLRRPDTGMFLYPAFLYFLEEEFFRNYRSKASLSVIIFDLKSAADGEEGTQTLPTVAIVDAVLRISELKRNVDLLADYDKGMYALILPNTKAAGTKTFANRVIKAITDVPLQGLPPNHTLSLAFGAASIPEDFGDLGRLLGGAELALSQSRATKSALVMYDEIKEMVDLPSDA